MFVVLVAELVNNSQSVTLGVATLGESIVLFTTTVVEPQIPGEHALISITRC